MANDLEKEGRADIEGVPARMLMGIDDDDNKRFLRCDQDGFLLVKITTDELEG